MYTCMCMYIYIYTHTHTHNYITSQHAVRVGWADARTGSLLAAVGIHYKYYYYYYYYYYYSSSCSAVGIFYNCFSCFLFVFIIAVQSALCSGYSLPSAEGGAVGGGCSGRGSIIQSNSLRYNVNHYTLFPLHPPLMNLELQEPAM